LAPRAYTQRRRAEQAAATRGRIAEAALEVYRERGVGGATLVAIGERADVSRGTILHHFGDADGLLAAVLDEVLSEVDLPDETLLDGLIDPEDRIRAYAEAMIRFYDRTADWWRVFAGERNELPRLPALMAREQAFWESLGRLQAAALGTAAQDGRVSAPIGVLVHPWTAQTLVASGMALDDAAGLVGDLAVAVVRRATHDGAGARGRSQP